MTRFRDGQGSQTQPEIFLMVHDMATSQSAGCSWMVMSAGDSAKVQARPGVVHEGKTYKNRAQFQYGEYQKIGNDSNDAFNHYNAA